MCRVHPWPGMARVEDLHGEAERRLQPDGAMDGRAVGHPADLFPLPAELLVPYPAEEMQARRVSDDAKSSRIEPHPGMAEALSGAA